MRYHDFVCDSDRWGALALRSDDIIITTPPKCGTTWTQMLCALVLGVEPGPERPLSSISPWLDMMTRPLDEVIAALEAQTHRRFIKTHTPYDGLPQDDAITYVVVGRHPLDVGLSWAHHMDNIDMDRFFAVRVAAVGLDDLADLAAGPAPATPDDPRERLLAWLDASGPEAAVSGLVGLVHHLAGFWALRDQPNVHLFHYADLTADLPANVRRLAAALGVALDEDGVARICEAAAFERMRQDADVLVPNRDGAFWKSNESFFHHGSTGRWTDLLDEEDLERYRTRITELSPDEAFVRWLHEGTGVKRPGGAGPAA